MERQNFLGNFDAVTEFPVKVMAEGAHISVIFGPGGPKFTVRLGPGGPRSFMTPSVARYISQALSPSPSP